MKAITVRNFCSNCETNMLATCTLCIKFVHAVQLWHGQEQENKSYTAWINVVHKVHVGLVSLFASELQHDFLIVIVIENKVRFGQSLFLSKILYLKDSANFRN